MTKTAKEIALGQWFTPEWAALALVEEFFPGLGSTDLVIEPSCGRGAFLKAIPPHVPALGVEIDAALAREARANSGRPVHVGDFRTIALPPATAVIGNPPFNLKLIEQFLRRAYSLLVDEGRCGLLLPSYAVQTPSRVLGWARDWSLQNAMIPRTLFPRMIRPLVFVQFTKGKSRFMCGFSLYRQAQEVSTLAQPARLLLMHGAPRIDCWRAVVQWALAQLGGQACLGDIYDVVEPKRLNDGRWWREKVRQTLQRHFKSVQRGVWALPAAA